MTAPTPEQPADVPKTAADVWAQRRGKNIAIFAAVIGLGVLFFVITILRMS